MRNGKAQMSYVEHSYSYLLKHNTRMSLKYRQIDIYVCLSAHLHNYRM